MTFSKLLKKKNDLVCKIRNEEEKYNDEKVAQLLRPLLEKIIYTPSEVGYTRIWITSMDTNA